MQELFYLTDNRVVGQTLKGNSHLRLSCLADLQYSGLSGGSGLYLGATASTSNFLFTLNNRFFWINQLQHYSDS